MPPTFRDEGVRAAIEIRAAHARASASCCSASTSRCTYAHELLGSGDGGMGYLLKDRVASLDELRDAVERVAAGGTVLDPQVVRAAPRPRARDPLARAHARASARC